MTRFAIVTGCSQTSIGFLAARQLAEKGYRVILACRSDASGNAAQELIGGESKYLKLDLGSFQSIHSFAKQARDLDGFSGSLQLLVCNAGIAWSDDRKETTDGLEEIVGVNHVGHFLLLQLLLPDFCTGDAAPTPRVVHVASSLHHVKDKDKQSDKELLPHFPDGIIANEQQEFNSMMAYRISKLCNIWTTYELRKRHPHIETAAVSPGFIPTTGLARNAGFVAQFMIRFVLNPLQSIGLGPGTTPENGAAVIVQASTKELPAEGTGYFHLEKGEFVPIRSSDESYDTSKSEKLWDLSMQWCKLSS